MYSIKKIYNPCISFQYKYVIVVKQGADDKHKCYLHLSEFFLQQDINPRSVGEWTIPQLSIMIIYNSTWSILIQWIRDILSGDSLT